MNPSGGVRAGSQGIVPVRGIEGASSVASARNHGTPGYSHHRETDERETAAQRLACNFTIPLLFRPIRVLVSDSTLPPCVGLRRYHVEFGRSVMACRSRFRRAFTLIELLVVIAIIAILIGL